MSDYHSYYLNENRNVAELWDKEDIYSLLNKIDNIIPTIQSMTSQQNIVLKQISQTLYEINNKLKIFNEFGLFYNLGISGGAIREFLMNKTELINDFDIIFNFKDMNTFSLAKIGIAGDDTFKKTIDFQKLWKTYFPNEILLDINFNSLVKIVNKIIQENYNNTTLFLNSDGKTEDYQNEYIKGLIKIKDNQLPKNIDLIISAIPNSQFVTTYSFDLCKAYIDFSEDLPLSEENGYLNLLSKIIITPRMVDDIENKTMTMNLNLLNAEHIHYYMNKHYIKMKHKYPDFRLNYRKEISFIEEYDQEYKNKRIRELEDLERLANSYMLGFILDKKNDTNAVKMKV